MGIRYLKTYAALEGYISAEDAETLADWLRAHPHPQVHLGKCEGLHAAVLQVLLALKPTIKAPSPLPWLLKVLEPTQH